METENLRLMLETVEQISTEIFFLWIVHIMVDFVIAMTFYIILMIFAYKLFSLFSAHLTAKRMADKLGYNWPYSDSEKRRMYQVFNKGLQREKRASEPSDSIPRVA